MKIKVNFNCKEFELGFFSCLYYYFIKIPLSIRHYYFLLFFSDYNEIEDINYFIKKISDIKKLKKQIKDNFISKFNL